MDWSDKAEIYRGRKPRESLLWQLFDHHFDEFEYRYDDLFSREYGFFCPVVSHIVRKYLECGDLDQDFCREKVWEVDPLLCSYCGGLMKIVSFIYEHRVIKKILTYFGLLRGEEQKRGPPQHLQRNVPK